MKKSDFAAIMNAAWGFVRRNGYTLAEALKAAWANFKLKVRMHREIVRFYFRKVDGSIREAWGTLAENVIPATNGNSGRKQNDTCQTYFDTEKNDWRCYKKANLLNIA